MWDLYGALGNGGFYWCDALGRVDFICDALRRGGFYLCGALGRGGFYLCGGKLVSGHCLGHLLLHLLPHALVVGLVVL